MKIIILTVSVILASGCSTSPDTLCQLPRPKSASLDTSTTISYQADQAKIWDRNCTAIGWIRGK